MENIKIQPVPSGIGKQNAVSISVTANDNLHDRCDFHWLSYDTDGNEVGGGCVPMTEKYYTNWDNSNEQAIEFVLQSLDLKKSEK